MTDYDVHKYIKTGINTVTVFGVQFRPSSVGGDIKDVLFTITKNAAYGPVNNDMTDAAKTVFDTGTIVYVDVI